MVQFYIIGFLGAIHTYLKTACFSTDKKSLALRNDWLSIDLAWGNVAQSVDGSLWGFSTFKVFQKIFF